MGVRDPQSDAIRDAAPGRGLVTSRRRTSRTGHRIWILPSRDPSCAALLSVSHTRLATQRISATGPQRRAFTIVFISVNRI